VQTLKPLSKTVDVIRHTPLDGLGSFRPVLEQHGYAIRIVEPFVEDILTRDASEPDLVLVMGGAISVNDADNYPFINDELRYIERRLQSGKPMMGACLGGQMIAKASGARVYKNAAVEAGYLPVMLTEAGEGSCLNEMMANGGCTMHWHSDAFDLPAGAVRLAYSDLTDNQAYAIGRNVLGVQFHMEACPRTVGGWLVAYAGEVSRSGLDPHAMRAAIQRHGKGSSDAGGRALSAWLDGLDVQV
jgi:GMP synthase (glutamine-hydrolysing)